MRGAKVMSAVRARVTLFVSLCLALSLGGAGFASAEQPAAESKPKAEPGDVLLGEWWTEDNEGIIQFARYKDGEYRGTTKCCDTGLKDVNNPKPELRSRSNVGIVIIWGLKYDGDGEFSGGYVYNPRDGKTYRMKVEVLDKDKLKIRGYLGISLLGQNQTWVRVKKGDKRPAPKAAKAD